MRRDKKQGFALFQVMIAGILVSAFVYFAMLSSHQQSLTVNARKTGRDLGAVMVLLIKDKDSLAVGTYLNVALEGLLGSSSNDGLISTLKEEGFDTTKAEITALSNKILVLSGKDFLSTISASQLADMNKGINDFKDIPIDTRTGATYKITKVKVSVAEPLNSIELTLQ
jgi:hypothetical protein